MADLTNPIFTNEDAAVAHMEKDRWPREVICPLCGGDNVIKMGGKTQAGMWNCNVCRGKFTVRTGTVFERSHIPLHKWLLATHLMASSKKGISAHQLHRMLGITYKSAWFMAHRIREAMGPAANEGPLGGEGVTVEADETEIAPSRKSRPRPRSQNKKFVSLIERGGKVRSRDITKTRISTTREVRKVLKENLHHAINSGDGLCGCINRVFGRPIKRQFTKTCLDHLGGDFNLVGLTAILAAHSGSFLTGGP